MVRRLNPRRRTIPTFSGDCHAQARLVRHDHPPAADHVQALTGKREPIYHAAMLDPHTAAELDPDQITALVDDLIAAHGDWLPAYHEAPIHRFTPAGRRIAPGPGRRWPAGCF